MIYKKIMFPVEVNRENTALRVHVRMIAIEVSFFWSKSSFKKRQGR